MKKIFFESGAAVAAVIRRCLDLVQFDKIMKFLGSKFLLENANKFL